MYNSGKGVPQNYTKVARWYRKAASQGYGPAQWQLGTAYREGEGVPQEYGNEPQ